ncbi:uncharacterized protein LOC111049490 [Nilaparvata lugens]|uniref:uncharacterized protein LOC111049490 n=1 Tax=Nilaparvata lugens TaxID=108931 RepID=UPI00193C8A1A|nr:uncharacterized protein LOC111049490 [Nilaparvata lugens]
MASFTSLLSALVLVAGSQGVAVNPMGMADAGLGMVDAGVSAGMGLASTGMDAGKGLANAGMGAASSMSGRMTEEVGILNGNIQDMLGAQMKGGANILNNILKTDAAVLTEMGTMISSIAHLTGATSQQMLQILQEVMTKGPLAGAQMLQRLLAYIAQKKIAAGDKIVSKTSSFADGMKQKSFIPLNMLDNMYRTLGSVNDITSALTGTPSLAASKAATALTPPVV